MRHNELTVASSIRLSGNESLQVEKATVGTSLKLIDDIGLEVNVEGTGDMFSSRSFGEKGPEPVVAGRGGAFHQTTIRLAKGFVRKKISSGFGNIVLTLREKVACSSGRVGRVGGDRKGPSSWGPFVAVGNVVVGELVVGGTSWTPACSCPPASPDYEGDCEVCLSMGPSLKGVSVMELAVWSTVSYSSKTPCWQIRTQNQTICQATIDHLPFEPHKTPEFMGPSSVCTYDSYSGVEYVGFPSSPAAIGTISRQFTPNLASVLASDQRSLSSRHL